MNYHLNGPILKLIINNGRRNKKIKKRSKNYLFIQYVKFKVNETNKLKESKKKLDDSQDSLVNRMVILFLLCSTIKI